MQEKGVSTLSHYSQPACQDIQPPSVSKHTGSYNLWFPQTKCVLQMDGSRGGQNRDYLYFYSFDHGVHFLGIDWCWLGRGVYLPEK